MGTSNTGQDGGANCSEKSEIEMFQYTNVFFYFYPKEKSLNLFLYTTTQ